MRTIMRFATLALLTGFLSVSAAQARTHIYVRIAPPPMVMESPIPAPAPGYIWVPGFHQWNGSSYVWSQGKWATPPRRHAHWTAGRWVHDRQGYYWREGHWSRW